MIMLGVDNLKGDFRNSKTIYGYKDLAYERGD